MIGTTVGHYRIQEKLGEGGMGVVYKALDTHLDRFVALKVLPAERLVDVERVRRFIQEAKAASSLNHPNIVHIYDVAESGGQHYIAMEYVAGKPLDQLIGRKGLRLNEALRYASQTADALARAHAAGIIHRDLKPSNIMVSDDGIVKVVDFGLAKLIEREADSGMDQTIGPEDGTLVKTTEGTITGTVAYMSPEQAEGAKVDARSDIFSFGAVLYEMVTGRRAFQADSRVSTLAAVLREEPKPVSEFVPAIPRELERITSRCLRKNPDRRWQTMSDLKVALLELKEEMDSGTLRLPAAAAPRRRASWLPWAAAALLLPATAAITWYFAGRTQPAPQSFRAVPFTTYDGREGLPSFSPDGTQVTFHWDGESGGARPDVYIKLVGPGKPLRLTTEGGGAPAWSPDGKYIAFLRRLAPDRTAVMLIPALGGNERKIVELSVHPYMFSRASWFPDGKALAVAARAPGEETNSIFRCSIDTGELVRLTKPPATFTHGDSSPAVAPNGRALAFVRIAINSSSELHAVDLNSQGNSTGESVKLGPDNAYWPTWTNDSREVIFTNGRVRSSLIRMEPRPGAREINLGLPQSSAATVSARGNRLAYVESRTDSNVWEIDLAAPDKPASPPRKLLVSSQRDVAPQYSPNGKRIAFSSNRSGNLEIWLADADGSNGVPLTTLGANTGGSPRWSPDGQRIAFDCNLDNEYNIYVVPADGGKPARLTSGGGGNIVPAWSPDGKRIFFGSRRTGRFEIWSMDANGGDLRQVTKEGGFGPLVSPDGSTVYYARGEGDYAELRKVPAQGGPEQTVVPRIHRYSFAVTERGVYYSLREGAHYLVRFLDLAGGRTTDLVKVDEAMPDLGITITTDRRRLAFTKVDQYDSDLMLVENFR